MSNTVENKNSQEETSILAIQRMIAEEYDKRARRTGGRECLDFPLNANFIVVCDGMGVVRMGFSGPFEAASKALERAVKTRRGVPRNIPLERYGGLAVVPNPLPTREELEKQQT